MVQASRPNQAPRAAVRVVGLSEGHAAASRPGNGSAALPASAVGDIAPAAFFADALTSSVQFAEVEIMVDAAEWYRGFLVSRDSPVQPAREVLDVIANAFADVPHCNEPVAPALATLG